ncbi:MAG: hypothetical protein P8182_09800 [Deltaproteobacteria bacterium]
MYTLIFDESTFGNTERSLKMLRDVLVHRIDRHIAVIEVPSDHLCCGFLVLDKDAKEAVFVGDGFRTDNGGEGGAGYKSAKALLNLFGISSRCWGDAPNVWDAASHDEMPGILVRLVDEIQRSLKIDHYTKPCDRTPGYIR